MLVLSKEIAKVFKRKYSKKESLIGKKNPDPRLALITTTSAPSGATHYPELHIMGDPQRHYEFHFMVHLDMTLPNAIDIRFFVNATSFAR